MMHTPIFACPPRGTRIRARFDRQVHEVVVLRQDGEWSLLATHPAVRVPLAVHVRDIVEVMS